MFRPAVMFRHHVLFGFRPRYSSTQNYYQILQLQRNASAKDIKLQFKKLSKKYHPDLNSHLSPEEQEQNSQKYVEMVSAYDTLKNKKKKQQYDATLSSSAPKSAYASRSDPGSWQNSYYGEAKYYSKGRASGSGSGRASGSYTSRGYNNTRHRVHNFYSGETPKSEHSEHFSGRHRNHGDRHDVPHFDYNNHLHKHLKFEQHMLSKNLSSAERDAILRQLAADGDISKIDAELLTKHLMRQSGGFGRRETRSHTTQSNPYMYQGDTASSGMGLKAFVAAGGATTVYLLYQMVF